MPERIFARNSLPQLDHYSVLKMHLIPEATLETWKKRALKSVRLQEILISVFNSKREPTYSFSSHLRLGCFLILRL